jgi:hypothetical protein
MTMKYTVHVAITTDEGQTEIREIASVEREDLTPTTLGFTLAEGKAILKGLQAVVVQQQLTAYLETQRPCAHCGHVQRSKGSHTTQVRTVFGTISVKSPRLYQCPCQPHSTETHSPLAVLLSKHITPELLILETKWAALVSYGITAQLLQEVLPIDDALAPTIREHVFTVAERLEQQLGEEQWSFTDSRPAEWSRLPITNGPLTVGIDGGYVRVTIWLTVLQQTAKGLPEITRDEEVDYPLRDPVVRELQRLKWFLWHGKVYKALQVVQSVEMDLDAAVATSGHVTARKLLKAVEEFHTYSKNNAGFIPNYGERYRHGKRISTGFVESTVNLVISKRFCKKQQMAWTQRGAHLLLQIRTRVLNGDWEATFREWYPGFRAVPQALAA